MRNFGTSFPARTFRQSLRADASRDPSVVRATYAFRCGYCGISEVETGAELTVDHYQPVSRGGTDHPDNLVYACHSCNIFKGSDWNPDSDLRILHPLLDDLSAHVVEQADGRLVGLTATGEYHLGRLRLNRLPMVQRRHQLHQGAMLNEQYQKLLERVVAVEQWLQQLSDDLEQR